jgi:hypothetical protein
MTPGWGHLGAPPKEALWECSAEECRRRVEGVRARMAARELDYLASRTSRTSAI